MKLEECVMLEINTSTFNLVPLETASYNLMNFVEISAQIIHILHDSLLAIPDSQNPHTHPSWFTAWYKNIILDALDIDNAQIVIRYSSKCQICHLDLKR